MVMVLCNARLYEGWQGDEFGEGGDDCDDEDLIFFPTQQWYGDSDTDGFWEEDDECIMHTTFRIFSIVMIVMMMMQHLSRGTRNM